MKLAFLYTNEDMNWLAERIAVANMYYCAEVEGNEDCPSEVRLYAYNNYKCKPTVYVWSDDDRQLVCKSLGQNPQTMLIDGQICWRQRKQAGKAVVWQPRGTLNSEETA